MTAAPAKFTFDLDLGARHEHPSGVTESAMASSVAEARRDGFAEGFAEAERSLQADAARQLAAAAAALADRVAAISAELDDTRKAMLADAVGLAGAIGRKLAGALLAREPAGEIEALIAECMASLDGVPHLVIRCHPDLADAVRDIATARMATSGFTGRLVVMGDPEQQPGDGRIEWVDGGLVRDMAAITAEIDTRVAAFMAAKHIAADADGAEESEA